LQVQTVGREIHFLSRLPNPHVNNASQSVSVNFRV
jgi:hypothetical protein